MARRQDATRKTRRPCLLPSPTLSPTDPVPRGLLTLWARAGLHAAPTTYQGARCHFGFLCQRALSVERERGVLGMSHALPMSHAAAVPRLPPPVRPRPWSPDAVEMLSAGGRSRRHEARGGMARTGILTRHPHTASTHGMPPGMPHGMPTASNGKQRQASWNGGLASSDC